MTEAVQGKDGVNTPVVMLKEEDYELPDDQTSVWITVDAFSVRVFRTDEGVGVDLYPVGKESDCAIASTYVFSDEAIEDEDDCEHDWQHDGYTNNGRVEWQACKHCPETRQLG